MELNDISGEILDAAVKLHQRVGPGLLESVYEVLLAKDLQARGLVVQRQLPVPIELDGIRFVEGFRLDLLVEHAVVVEIKAVDRFAPEHWRQVLTYLRLLDLRLGLLINFSGPTLLAGFKRIVNRYVDSAPLRPGVERAAPADAEGGHPPGSSSRMT